MTGDQANVIFRLKSVLPSRWFGDSTPLLDTLLGSISRTWVSLFSLLGYVKRQARVMTATDVWLDIIAYDFLGAALARRTTEPDDQFRKRISAELVRERCTRYAVWRMLLDLTGRQPCIFEPANCGDTGGYCAGAMTLGPPGGGLGYGIAGGWGNLDLPFQVFVTAFRPISNGIALLPGWGATAAGYCAGSTSYATLEMFQAQVSDDDVRNATLAVLPTAVTAWMRIMD
jgi:hypothetical protein